MATKKASAAAKKTATTKKSAEVWTDNDDQTVVDFVALGMDDSAIAERMGRTKTSVSAKIKSLRGDGRIT